MNEIYLIPKKNLDFDKNIRVLFLKDLFDIYPEEERSSVNDINIKEIKNVNENKKEYEIISLGDVINKIILKNNNIKINFLDNKDLIVHFKENKKDKTKFLRVLGVCVILFLGAAMAIINFHSDVNMKKSHETLYRILTGKTDTNLLFLQIPYSLGIGVGVAVFYNKIIPNFSNSEPSPLEIEAYVYKKEIEDYIINNPNSGNSK